MKINEPFFGKTILLVEDNPKVMQNNTAILESRGASVLSALTLAEAHAIIADNSFDAAVLDIMLPDGSGLDFLTEIRETSDTPVLILTAKNTSDDVVDGLSVGADDYLVKPYTLKVFAARMDALLRRAGKVSENISIGRLRFELISNQAYYDGEDLLLSQKEFALLLLLAKNEGKYVTAGYLFKKAWGRPLSEDTASLRKQMSNLKKKISAVTGEILIETSYGEGYCLTMI